jgi:hypothetical protein
LDHLLIEAIDQGMLLRARLGAEGLGGFYENFIRIYFEDLAA